MSTNDGGPAFPVGDQSLHPLLLGMTLRDWFAGMALQALIRMEEMKATSLDGEAYIARYAYRQADAMLAERGKKP